ncbi:MULTISPECIES: hypothetical protein [unclassified Bradyrhizobium]|uniref:hypothetical protein n=1 Tax=unclassified Bradyrhizobium TaxID=2631580 RepID=UPI001FF838B9|nr:MULTISPECIES: hypothetical protein [unclassified Bradyrhizobium]MCK1709724.1 hypothetical protein [Bradyrhizobium sp. 143]MCK1725416.1 hypothetical protein [Bradyrhizobium sp. 142]
MERIERLRALLKQKADIERELDTIHKQLNEEAGLLKKNRKPRKKKEGAEAQIQA